MSLNDRNLGRGNHGELRSGGQKFKAISLQLGTILDPETFVAEWFVEHDVTITIDYKFTAIYLYFSFALEEGQMEQYKMEANFKNLDGKMVVLEDGHNQFTLTMTLKRPGRFWKLFKEGEEMTDTEWNLNDQWVRIVTIPLAKNVDTRFNSPLTPRSANNNVIQLGRWIVYRLQFQFSSDVDGRDFTKMLHEATEYNIVAYDAIEQRFKQKAYNVTFPQELPAIHNPADYFHDDYFDVLYTLERLILQNWLNERNLPELFYKRLASMGCPSAMNFLERLGGSRKRIFDPVECLDTFEKEILSTTLKTLNVTPDVPPHCVMVRKIIVTPTTMNFLAPTMETSNRVVRNYEKEKDRFLRIQFVDDSNMKVSSTGNSSKTTNDAIYDRIYDVLRSGIKIGSRTYTFLAFSNSQLREHACWFFAQTPELTCDQIREWMGDFSDVKIVAKNAARMGQVSCF